MRKPVIGLLLLITGWYLGWYANDYWQAGLPATETATPIVTPSNGVTVDQAVMPTRRRTEFPESMAALLRKNRLQEAMQRFELLQQTDEQRALAAREQILAHAGNLVQEHRYGLARRILELFVAASYRDVDAYSLLARAYSGEQNRHAAIDALYQARADAWRPATLDRLTQRTRALVKEQAASYKSKQDDNGLLEMYEHLTELEPDYPPYFIALATAQLVLDDIEGAWRSLQLVAQDPDMGPKARAMLARLETLQQEQWSASTTPVAGIPLRRRGQQFVVAARANQAETVSLLIDTGASLTIITPDALQRYDIRYKDSGRTGVFNTANGRVRGPIYVIDTLAIGDWQVHDIEIGALNLSGGTNIDGLLGMNFLKHFRFFIDQNEGVLRLSLESE